MTSSSFELIRQMTGPVMIGLLAVLLDAGLNPRWISLPGWIAIALAIVGAFLWISATSLPRNPLIQKLIPQQGLQTHSPQLRLAVGITGAILWLAAMGLILFPADRLGKLVKLL